MLYSPIKTAPLRSSLLLACLLPVLASCSSVQTTPEEPRPLKHPEVFQSHSAAFKSETVTIVLEAFESTEVKAAVEKDQVILYQWSVEGGPVYVDFHGHDPADKSYWVRYREQESGTSAHGSLVAPLSGQHGWYFRNDGESKLTITLEVTGYFSEIINHGIF